MNHFRSIQTLEHFLKEELTVSEDPQPAGAGKQFAFGRTWATIGAYDGVHIGHQAILTRMASQAHAAGAAALVITFHPHPVVVLRGVTQPIYLTSPEERARLITDLGIDAVLTMTFDRALAGLTAEEFMQKMVDHMGLKQLWVGPDFALGRNRQGDIPTLREIGTRLGYTVQVIDTVEAPTSDGAAAAEKGKVSSSSIRELVRQGAVAEARRILGRPYSLEGPVTHGEARGRKLGFPTANVAYWPEKITPALGVYATWVQVGDKRFPAVTNVGLNPTFTDQLTLPRVEAYLLDYSGDLYGQEMRVDFLEFLRPELRFDSVQALIDQMNQDTQRAREVLSHAA